MRHWNSWTRGIVSILAFLIATWVPEKTLGAWTIEDIASGTEGRLRIGMPGLGEDVGVLGATGSAIRYWSRSGGSWVDSTVASVGASGAVGLAFHPSTGAPHVAYVSGTNVYLAQYDGNAWSSEHVFTGDVEHGVSLAFDGSGKAGIATAGDDGFTGALTYLWREASGWQSHTISTNHGGFLEPSIAFEPTSDLPVISYGKQLEGVGLAEFDGSSWSTRMIDSFSFPGQTELRFLPGSHDLVVGYVDTWTNTLRVAKGSGTAWQIQDVETGQWGNTDIGVYYQFGMDVGSDDTTYVAWQRGFSPDALYLSKLDAGLVGWKAFSEYRIAGSALLMDGESLAVAFNNSWTAKLRYATPEPATFSLLFLGGFVLMRRHKRNN